MGDFWGIDKIEPEIDDDIGISLAIVNTDKGARLMEGIAPQIYAEERNIDMAVPRQINLRSAPAVSYTHLDVYKRQERYRKHSVHRCLWRN